MGKSLFLEDYPRPHPKGAGSQRSPVLGLLSIYACIFYRRTTEFAEVTHLGSGLVLVVSHAPTATERAPALPNFGSSFLFIYTHPFVAVLPNLRGGACILASATPPIPRERSSSTPNFVFFLSYIYAYTLQRSYDQIRRGDT